MQMTKSALVAKYHSNKTNKIPTTNQKLTQKLTKTGEKLKNQQNRNWQDRNWYEKNECASIFWLKVTLILVSIFHYPILRPILKLCIAFVTGVYFVFSPNERRNIVRFYENVETFRTGKNPSKTPQNPLIQITQKWRKKWHKTYQVYSNFYEFGSAICDKIAAWLGKINHKDIEVRNIEAIKNELLTSKESKKGQILVVSHFGNIEVCRALRNSIGEIPLVILMYEKIAQDFIALLKNLSKDKESNTAQNDITNSGIMLVDDLDMDSLFRLKDLLENGVNIGIMGDRVAISHSHKSKNAKFDFLGKSAYFPQGAFLLAGVLNAKISMLWCEKIKGKYTIELEEISQTPVVFRREITKEAQIKELMQKYVDSLQKRAIANPKSWFNFYDFWGNQT